MSLNFQVFGESGKPLVLVHGLFGSIANWRTVARELAKEHIVYVVDQRNHGDSLHLPSMTYTDMASDLNDLIVELQLEDFILCGHSMGGKAAMVYALSDFESKQEMSSLIVLDIAPVTYGHSHASYLQAMSEIDLSEVESRSQVDKLLKSDIADNATRLFLMQSLEREGASWRWKINIPVLQKYMPNIVGFPDMEVADKQSLVDTLFLFGSKSNYVSDDMHAKIHQYFKRVQFDSVEAGHWLHVEQRQAMLDSINKFLKK